MSRKACRRPGVYRGASAEFGAVLSRSITFESLDLLWYDGDGLLRRKILRGNLEKDMVIRKPKFFQIRQGL